jgi:hypothetical protein
MPFQERLVVVAPHAASSRAAHDGKDAEGVGAAREQIAQEKQVVSRVVAHDREQLLELLAAPVDVSDDDGTASVR